jgi:hypothetical protein
MASRLFHTIVGVGISLSLASLACSAPSEQTTGSSDESALTTGDQTPAGDNAKETPAPAPSADPQQATDYDAGPTPDAFCDAVWPTTKGAGSHAPACANPNHECGGAPDYADAFECVSLAADGTSCVRGRGVYSVCLEGAWACRPGQKRRWQCTSFTD